MKLCARYLLACLFTGVLLCGGVWAQSSDTTERLEAAISEYEALLVARAREQARIDQELAGTQAALAERVAERNRVSEQLAALREERRGLLADIADLEGQLAANEARIRELEAELVVLRGRLSELIVNLHRERSSRYARVLAQSESFFDLRVKNYYLGLLAEQDVAILSELDATVSELETVQATLTAQVRDLEAAQQALLNTEQNLASTQQNLGNLIASLESTRAGQLAQRRDLLSEQSQLEAVITTSQQQLNAEIDRLRREAEEARRRAAAAAAVRERERFEAQAAQAEQGARALEAARDLEVVTVPTNPTPTPTPTPTAPTPPTSVRAPQTGDAFTMPFDQPQLLSRYGEEGPYVLLRSRQEGSAVRAALGGTVRAISRISANSGYLVAVYHGPNLMTAYLNLQPPQLAVGDTVAPGQIVGYLGGGTLTPADTLKFFVGVPQDNGGAAWIDPLPRLGL
ncbi:MAG: peptidoglycan DD-metalloendopeptidase family protein [Trueperaceae bacterium]|nr:peptidoglycan DD-metalloendopeptidase family protein [Trueperaceae bacterium]